MHTELVRDGRRVKAAEVRLACEGNEVARASVQMLRRSPHPLGTVWAPAGWDAPHPDTLAPREIDDGRPGAMVWDMRPVTAGEFGAQEQRRLWLRERRDLVAGEPLTPFVRVAMVADFTNPFTNFSDQGLAFINADLTLYLARLPVDEWIGFESAGHLGDNGVAVGHANLYDIKGAIGHCTVAAVATQAMVR
jgi:hypothetical protein